VMGWTKERNQDAYRVKVWTAANEWSNSQLMSCSKWRPSIDYNDAAMLRAKIAERCAGRPVQALRYQLRLMDVLAKTLSEDYPHSIQWAMLNTTPRETTIACILAAQEKQ